MIWKDVRIQGGDVASRKVKQRREVADLHSLDIHIKYTSDRGIGAVKGELNTSVNVLLSPRYPINPPNIQTSL